MLTYHWHSPSLKSLKDDHQYTCPSTPRTFKQVDVLNWATIDASESGICSVSLFCQEIYPGINGTATHHHVLLCITMYYYVLLRITMCCSIIPCTTMCCSVIPCTVHWSVLPWCTFLSSLCNCHLCDCYSPQSIVTSSLVDDDGIGIIKQSSGRNHGLAVMRECDPM